MPEVLRRGFSRNYIGNLATISEIEARPDIRLYDAYIEQSFWGGALSLNVGQQAADVEFFDSETDDPDEHKRATSIQKHRSFGFDNCALAAQQGVLQHNPPQSGHARAHLDRSVKCHFRTHAPQHSAPLSDHLIGVMSSQEPRTTACSTSGSGVAPCRSPPRPAK